MTRTVKTVMYFHHIHRQAINLFQILRRQRFQRLAKGSHLPFLNNKTLSAQEGGIHAMSGHQYCITFITQIHHRFQNNLAIGII